MTATTEDKLDSRLFDTVLKNFRSEEFSCGCFNSHWRNRRESGERGGAALVRFRDQDTGNVEAEQLHECSLFGLSRKRVILLFLYRQSRKIERIWPRRSVPRARHCARRLTTSHEVTIRCRSEGGKCHSHQQAEYVGNGDLDVGAGDQDITFGCSSDETEDVMPLTHSMSTRLERN